MKLRPLGDRVILKYQEAKEKTQSGLILLIAAAGIRGGRGIVGRPAGRRAGVYHNSDHVEIILEKDLRRHLWKEELSP